MTAAWLAIVRQRGDVCVGEIASLIRLDDIKTAIFKGSITDDDGQRISGFVKCQLATPSAQTASILSPRRPRTSSPSVCALRAPSAQPRISLINMIRRFAVVICFIAIFFSIVAINTPSGWPAVAIKHAGR